MHGISEVIAIILILMITISLAGLAYMFMSTTMSDVTASAGLTVDTTTTSMLTSFTIESIDVAKVYVRNTGQNALTSLSVYVNDEPAVYNLTPISIASGAVGTITIYSFIPDGAMVKVVSPSGFSASKTAQPCSKSVGCWKFDELTGTTAYDSSPNGNDGVIYNGTTRIRGISGKALKFDGLDDFMEIQNSQSLNPGSSDWTIGMWFKQDSIGLSHINILYNKENTYEATAGGGNFSYAWQPNWNWFGETPTTVGEWYYVVVIYDHATQRVYMNGSLVYSRAQTGNMGTTTGTLRFGARNGPFAPHSFFNGTIDEVRIYNRAIY